MDAHKSRPMQKITFIRETTIHFELRTKNVDKSLTTALKYYADNICTTYMMMTSLASYANIRTALTKKKTNKMLPLGYRIKSAFSFSRLFTCFLAGLVQICREISRRVVAGK